MKRKKKLAWNVQLILLTDVALEKHWKVTEQITKDSERHLPLFVLIPLPLNPEAGT